MEFTAADTDQAALILLRDLDARNVEIAATTLDSAFLSLTGEQAQPENGVIPTGDNTATAEVSA